ncbi:hypothetical protein C1752_00209 [Acaryochloris thomasi RCC1774]|uniref:Uncharacterized protein n=1 Tax=Acaryochloris thomasi RCC1774 TaxID=1764569 RepID=A0A2W1JQ32_9CYAN|nr:hypothetical protein [Acaryochloris thomasi]PZD75433.1 hypothetical protein C1752_00209 [Acaryochloris thomasi RCC1774]
MNITRRHLMGLGATRYQSEVVTQSCPVKDKAGSANLYTISDVIQAITVYLERSRIRQATKNNLRRVLSELQPLASTVVETPFGAPETGSTAMVKQLLKSFDNPKTRKHKLKAISIKGQEVARAR